MTRLVVVSNRLPIIIDQKEGRFHIRAGAGGLVTALKPFLEERGGAWIGFSGMFQEDRGKGWEETLDQYGDGAVHYYAITPPRAVYDGYYLEYANQELWPRFHSLTGKMSESAAEHWGDYVAINELFAEMTQRSAGGQGAIWVQDYHLMLLPQLLRERLPDAHLGHFLHIPFPPPEIMATQPHVREVLRGVLGADLLGFHIPAYMENFVAAAEQIVGAEVMRRSETEVLLSYENRRIRLGAFPIGIQPEEMQQADPDAVRRRLPGAADTLILSMDRLDYTKAIPPRLEAYKRLLDANPDYRGRISLVQLIDLSRKKIPAYQEEREKVEHIVHLIEREHDSWKSLFFSAERWPRAEVAGLMQRARVCVVTPRCDGMNLVSKEYIAAAPEDGVLVLSRQAGAAWQLGRHAVMVDGNSPADIEAGLHKALEMPLAERRERMAQLKENVRREDVFWWARKFLDSLPGNDRNAAGGLPMALDQQDEILAGFDRKRFALLLDYDGTLTPIVRRPEEATLSERMRELLLALSQQCPLAIVSGRDRRDVSAMVGIDSLVYAGSHGFDIRGPQIEMQHADARPALPHLDAAEESLRNELRTIPGARIERKEFAIAVHYREVRDEDVSRIEQAVRQAHRQHPTLRTMSGKKIYELQPDVPWDKGRAILWLAESLGWDADDMTLIYLGDDVTDEDAFRALRERVQGIGIRVGSPDTSSAAAYCLRDCAEVEQFLTALLAHFRSQS